MAAPAISPATASSAQAALCITAPQRLYAGEGEGEVQTERGGWLVVVDMPPNLQGLPESLLDGDAGRLLDQMLRALGLHTGRQPVHALRLWRATPGQPGSSASAVDFDADFDAAIAPLAPQIVLALGPLSAQRLLGQKAPLGRLRGSVHHTKLAGAPCAVVASYPPAYLLRNSADKARAWADLCMAAASAAHAEHPGSAA